MGYEPVTKTGKVSEEVPKTPKAKNPEAKKKKPAGKIFKGK